MHIGIVYNVVSHRKVLIIIGQNAGNLYTCYLCTGYQTKEYTIGVAVYTTIYDPKFYAIYSFIPRI